MKMQQRSMTTRLAGVSIALAFTLAAISPALAADVNLKKGTDIKLAFDNSMSSKTAKPGDVVQFHVTDPVTVDGKTVIEAGTKVTGRVVKVDKRKHYGVNAKIQLKMDAIKAVDGKMVELGFKTKTPDASRTGTAAGTTIGGAAVLGPIGLAAGYFVVGKSVDVKPGDKMTVEAEKDSVVDVK